MRAGAAARPMARDQLVGHLAMVAFAVLVAGSFSLGSRMANDIDPGALTALRFLLAASLLAVFAALGPGFRPAHFRAPWRYGVLGALYGAYFVLMFEGLKTAPAVATAAVFTLTPAMTAGFGWLFLRQVTTPRMAVALAIGAAGALWVIFRADLGALIAFDLGRGEAIYFIGCILHAVFTPLLKLFNRGEPASVSSTLVIAAGFVLLLGWSWQDLRAIDWAALPLLVWVTLVYIAVFASAITFFILQVAALRLPSAKVMAYTYLVPSGVILWEIALGGVPPAPLVLAGVGLTALALAILLKDEDAPRTPVAPG